MTKILILGGTAWLGRTLCEQALARGHEVHALARGSHEFAAGVQPIIADRTLPGAYEAARAIRWDLVIELTRDPGQARGAVEALADTAAHWVNVSSCSVYADQSIPGADEDAAVLEPLPPETPADDYDYGRAKSYGEHVTMEARGGRALVVRSGLIGGPGDPSGRSTYWPLRFSEERRPVLVPGDPGNTLSVQIIDVRDLAAFILDAGLAGRHGHVNAVGEQTTLAEALHMAQAAGGGELHPRTGVEATPSVVHYDLTKLEADNVNVWAGPKSLPLVLPPGPEHAGFTRRSDARSLAMGLRRRALLEIFTDIVRATPAGDVATLKSGLSPDEEAALIAASSG
ncbi:NAD-dependent epimerase/dehydratase family protein [Paeniglutamicibacter kerguelensis]|uniref:Nucleoside-diphosphate-sugar epimerase n=1 Tax=Paeniglutamicibacter kerguelensis TaxID=254788 RepID=A0ABS4XFA2_9MICC|nr:NAD-dependent epimerase/dehydratase family protein [Paeniglutamicibacter kerguelensis]MBP2387078.1 nucleoside-diphosphate-sugar epimerase [Paeniglutamicibacter kerguelensis]